MYSFTQKNLVTAGVRVSFHDDSDQSHEGKLVACNSQNHTQPHLFFFLLLFVFGLWTTSSGIDHDKHY